MIKIITDSASDIRLEENLGIEILPLTVIIDGQEYKDDVELKADEFYARLPKAHELPKTSQVTYFQFTEAYDKVDKNDEAIVITISSKLSGTYQQALSASKDRSNIHVIDSLNVSLGEKIIILRALELIKNGLTCKEIVDTIEREKNNVKVIGLVDTLEYLKKGGRIGHAAAFIGNILMFKPVIELNNGAIGLLGKARGSKNGHNKLREITKNEPIDFSKPYCAAYSGKDRTSLDEYIADSKDLYGDNKIPVIQIGAAIGTHIGPNTVALAYFKR